jgi:hypothetical protein
MNKDVFNICYLDDISEMNNIIKAVNILNNNNIKANIIVFNNSIINENIINIKVELIDKLEYINKCDVIFTNNCYYTLNKPFICHKNENTIKKFGENYIGFFNKDTPHVEINNIFIILKYYYLIIKKPKYDVLILTTHDWCNTGYRYYLSLLENNIKVHILKIYGHHIFNYSTEAPFLFSKKKDLTNNYINNVDYKIISEDCPYYHYIFNNTNICNIIQAHIEQSNIIYLHAETFIEIKGYNYMNKKIITGVSGHPYRRKPHEYSKFFNKFIYGSLIQCPDLLNLGLKNEHLIYYGVNTNIIKPISFNNNNKILKIGHFPSNPETKGSNDILNAIKYIVSKYPNRFIYNGTNMNNSNHKTQWNDNLNRMGECDIYIETCKPYLNAYSVFKEYNNTQFGEWGNTCLEASALGCIVITNSLTYDYYIKEYTEEYPLLIANNYNTIIKQLEYIVLLNDEEILTLKKKYRKWVEENHSLYNTGKRFYDKLLKPLLKS